MNRPNRQKMGIDRMRPVLVDAEGQVWSVTSPYFFMRPRQPDGNIVDYAVSRLGFIHIWSVDASSIVVALRPDLVHPKTMTAAFYAIADLRPVRVFVSVTNTAKQRWELFNSVDRALSRIDRLVTMARRSSIGTRLLRVWENLRASDRPGCRYAASVLDLCDLPKRRGGAAAVISPPARTLRRTRVPRGKAAMLAGGFAAPFLTRLAAVSSLSFALPRVLHRAPTT